MVVRFRYRAMTVHEAYAPRTEFKLLRVLILHCLVRCTARNGLIVSVQKYETALLVRRTPINELFVSLQKDETLHTIACRNKTRTGEE
jgi:hypothetical protein